MRWLGLSLSLATASALAQAPEPSPGPATAGPATTEDLSQLVDSVDRLLESSRREAEQKLADKDYPAALRALSNAYELDARDPEIVLPLAELYALLGNVERAEALYREALVLAPDAAQAHVGLAALLSREGADEARLAEAARLLARARELSGNDPGLLLRQARVAVARGRYEEAEQAYAAYRKAEPLDDALRLELGDFYRDFDQPERALEFYREVKAQEPSREAAKRIFELQVEREARRYGLRPRTQTVSPQAQALLARARGRIRDGKSEEAARLLRDALSLSPAFALAHAELGRLLHARGQDREAELAYLRALAIDNGQVEASLGLAELYLQRSGSEPAVQAALFLERAQALRPDMIELELELARANRRAGDLPRALFYVERYLAQGEQAASRPQALELRALLRSAVGDDATGQVPSGDEPAARALSRARALLSQGAVEAALVELRQLGEGGASAEAKILEARILHAANKPAEAATLLQQVLAGDYRNAEAHERLGLVRLAQGDERSARRHLLEAERLGSLESTFHLARLDAGDGGGLTLVSDALHPFALFEARDRLRRFAASSATLYRDEAARLDDEVSARLWSLALALGAVLLAVGAGALWLRERRFGGIDLATLLERAPDAGPELSRILSAIAHEVLKHNTMMLSGLCERMARGETVGEVARQIDRALFGDDGRGGAFARLNAYIEQLEQLGRTHGQRLNLVERDPAVSALTLGFQELAALRVRLAKVDALSTRARRRLLSRLREATALLNEEAHAELRALLEEMRVLRVDEGLVRQIFERTAGEPALAVCNVAPLCIDDGAELPITIQVPRQAFDDMLANLFRNALQAERRTGDALEVGLDVRRDVDVITGLERAHFSVRDRASTAVGRDQLRARAIEAGLGLTADLVNRYEGSLDVRSPEPGWAKAVVLALPAAEPGAAY